MKRRSNIVLLAALGLAVAGGFWHWQIQQMVTPKERSALELKTHGGSRYLLAIDGSLSDSEKQDATEGLQRRFQSLGIENVLVERFGEDRIFVNVPTSAGELDMAKLTRPAQLTFQMAHPEYIRHYGADMNDPPIVPGADLIPYADDPNRAILVRSKIEISGDDIERASATNGLNSWQILVALNKTGGDRLYDLSKTHNSQSGTGLPFAIILNGEVLSSPVFNEPIAGGSAQIGGDFTEPEARRLASALQIPIAAAFKVLGHGPIGPAQ